MNLKVSCILVLVVACTHAVPLKDESSLEATSTTTTAKPKLPETLADLLKKQDAEKEEKVGEMKEPEMNENKKFGPKGRRAAEGDDKKSMNITSLPAPPSKNETAKPEEAPKKTRRDAEPAKAPTDGDDKKLLNGTTPAKDETAKPEEASKKTRRDAKPAKADDKKSLNGTTPAPAKNETAKPEEAAKKTRRDAEPAKAPTAEDDKKPLNGTTSAPAKNETAKGDDKDSTKKERSTVEDKDCKKPGHINGHQAMATRGVEPVVDDKKDKNVTKLAEAAKNETAKAEEKTRKERGTPEEVTNDAKPADDKNATKPIADDKKNDTKLALNDKKEAVEHRHRRSTDDSSAVLIREAPATVISSYEAPAVRTVVRSSSYSAPAVRSVVLENEGYGSSLVRSSRYRRDTNRIRATGTMGGAVRTPW